MSLKHLIGVTLVIASVTPALADYYIVREQGSKECRVVRERPTVSTTTVVGNSTYTTEEEARGAIKTVCVER